MKRFSSICLLIFVLVSCVKVLEIPAPNFVKKVVLEGILDLNQPLSVSLHYNVKADSKDSLYPVITNATLGFYENDVAIGQAKHTSKGLYVLNYLPKEGKVYKVMVDVPDYGKVEAQETMPFKTVLTAIASERIDSNPNRNPTINIAFTKKTTQNTFYWLGVYQQISAYKWTGPGICTNLPTGNVPPECKLEYYLSAETNIFATNSELPDRFNGDYDSLNGIYTYTRFMRLDNSKMKSEQVALDFTLSNPAPSRPEKNEAMYVRLMTTGANFDKYLKSAIEASFNRPGDAYGNVNNPFAEPIPVYTNVKNGVGIFGALIETEQKITVIK